QDNKSCTLYLMDLVNGNRAKIKDGFEDNILNYEVSKGEQGILIKSLSGNGTLKHYLFNGKEKFLGLQNALKSQVKFATYFL
ncbi:MAG: hypothetical protein NTV78_00480, partial [Caldiserica bacterium]|nr:hypothetical protein [Caldisericota bacterium]